MSSEARVGKLGDQWVVAEQVNGEWVVPDAEHLLPVPDAEVARWQVLEDSLGLRIPEALTAAERDLVAYSAYTQAHNQLDPRYAIAGVTDEGDMVMRPMEERISEFKRWREIGDAISATRFNRPTWSLVDGDPK